MCGIYGKVRFDGRPPDPEQARCLCALMKHRGPDDEGVQADGPAVLAHRRLAIIDLSAVGHQPMANEDGSLWIVFNGEIYNYAVLRPALEAKGHRFRSRTDTEVLLHLYEEEGPACLDRLRGMFAFAIWSARDRTLFLARDRLGKKPLFYHHGPACFAFASELGALAADPEIPREVDLEAIHHYLTFQSVPAPWSAFRAVRKLPPAHWLMLRDGRVEMRRYWRLSFGPKLEARTARQRLDREQELLAKLREAVRLRLVSDVPLGALLSGGLDSSGVVALMAEESTAPVRTFSVGFEEESYDELRWARSVAAELGTDHHELVLRPDRMSVLPELVEHFGEPFADPAMLPLYLIAGAAREHVVVALCGDGGDEAFAGYQRYQLNALLGRLPRVPASMARAAGRLLSLGPKPASSHSGWWIARRLAEVLPLHPALRNLRLLGHFDGATKRDLCAPDFARAVVPDQSERLVLQRYDEVASGDLVDSILATDLETHLPDTLLPKADVTSMAHGLELRSPLLDHELLELAARLPTGLKLRGLRGKVILRRALRHELPRATLDRPKRGFALPLEDWFRAELRGLARETLLSPTALDRGYFAPETVRRILDEHETGRRLWHNQIFNLLMLELWHRRFCDRR